jgi:adenine-specific DNA methylase
VGKIKRKINLFTKKVIFFYFYYNEIDDHQLNSQKSLKRSRIREEIERLKKEKQILEEQKSLLETKITSSIQLSEEQVKRSIVQNKR